MDTKTPAITQLEGFELRLEQVNVLMATHIASKPNRVGRPPKAYTVEKKRLQGMIDNLESSITEIKRGQFASQATRKIRIDFEHGMRKANSKDFAEKIYYVPAADFGSGYSDDAAIWAGTKAEKFVDICAVITDGTVCIDAASTTNESGVPACGVHGLRRELTDTEHLNFFGTDKSDWLDEELDIDYEPSDNEIFELEFELQYADMLLEIA